MPFQSPFSDCNTKHHRAHRQSTKRHDDETATTTKQVGRGGGAAAIRSASRMYPTGYETFFLPSKSRQGRLLLVLTPNCRFASESDGAFVSCRIHSARAADIQLPHVPLVRDVGFLISDLGRRATSHCLDDSQTMCLSNRPGWLLCGALDKPPYTNTQCITT